MKTTIHYSYCLPIHLVNGDEIKKRWKEYMEELYKKALNELDYYDGVVSHPDQIFWSVKSSGLKKYCY